MAQEVNWSAGKPGFEDTLLEFEADTAAYSGRLGKAQEFSRRAMNSANEQVNKIPQQCILPCLALGKPCMATRRRRTGR